MTLFERRLSTFNLAALLVAAAMACSHAHSVGDTEASSERAAGSKSHPQDGEHGKRHGETGSAGDASASSSSQTDGSGQALPLSTSPAGLLKPGALRDIQKALTHRGYLDADKQSGTLDAATEKALRAFQRDNRLPGTGMPDDATIRKLGLSVPDTFKAAPTK